MLGATVATFPVWRTRRGCVALACGISAEPPTCATLLRCLSVSFGTQLATLAAAASATAAAVPCVFDSERNCISGRHSSICHRWRCRGRLHEAISQVMRVTTKNVEAVQGETVTQFGFRRCPGRHRPTTSTMRGDTWCFSRLAWVLGLALADTAEYRATARCRRYQLIAVGENPVGNARRRRPQVLTVAAGVTGSGDSPCLRCRVARRRCYHVGRHAHGIAGRAEQARPRSRGQEASPRAAVAFPGNQGGAPTDEQGGDDVELVKCDDCGRKFAPDRLEKHQKICRKVFMEKRKKFDSAANRLDHFENAQELIHGAKKIEHEVKAKEAQAEVPAKGLDKNGGAGAKEGKEKPMPAWKKKSLEFRAAMLAQKVQEGDDADAKEKLNELKKELATAGPSDAVDPGMVKCPNCGRTFNKESGERHMNICKAKPAARLQKAGGGAGGAAGRDASKSRTEAPPTAAGGRSSGVAARPGGPAAAPAARRSNSVGQRR
eukprot:TRINITY_DN26204_c0_g1_i1.p1 TRINITY_DN26204_c0_g1~~TRINITY_DN26204_c0_g1_i1.p1  ORF type:complete len:491 (+),score=78.20 TRINITY_DN26204_c0_g1_i1:249-1721(+)